MAHGMHNPVTSAEKDRIYALHSDGLSCAAIAKEIGRSKSAVARHAEAMGLKFDRHLVAEAAHARVIDGKARRSILTHRLLDEAERLIDRINQPYRVWRINNDGDLMTGLLDLPDARDQRDLMVAATTAIEKSLRLEDYDRDTGNADDKSMLTDLREGLTKLFANRST